VSWWDEPVTWGDLILTWAAWMGLEMARAFGRGFARGMRRERSER
jgi:hypothetical protein